MNIFDLVVGILSIILGFVALAVSWKLFRMSEEGTAKMREAETAVANHVKELDRLFNLLYADTWSLVRDSYTSMQEQMWRSVSAREGANTQGPTGDGGKAREPTDGLNSPAPNEANSERVQEGGAQLELVLLEAYEKLSRKGVRVRTQDLVTFAERLGYPPIEAINSLHDLIFDKQRLFLASNRFAPQAIVANTAESASHTQEALADETIEQMARGLPSVPPD